MPLLYCPYCMLPRNDPEFQPDMTEDKPTPSLWEVARRISYISTPQHFITAFWLLGWSNQYTTEQTKIADSDTKWHNTSSPLTGLFTWTRQIQTLAHGNDQIFVRCMCPTGIAINHPDVPLLIDWATTGCHVDSGHPWSIEKIIESAIRNLIVTKHLCNMSSIGTTPYWRYHHLSPSFTNI